ncbi:MAG: N-acetylglutaminylglutamine amidotransferase [Kineosporiaceae bacterium]
MCGVSGEIRFDPTPADVTAVAAMCEAQAARGPDGQGVWSQGRVALGHRRLRIIDLSDHGAQPMVDAELGLALVFNGCVYNYRELRDELAGHGYRFFSTSDTEVILKAYHRWGVDCVRRFHGMFAFVIHERDTGVVVAARDRLGVKPLYLDGTPARLRFASSLPALVRAGRTDGSLDTSVDPVALHHYLSWHAVVPAPRTMLRGVRKLPPATVAVWQPDGSRQDHRYWAPDYVRDPDRAGWSDEDWTDAVLDALRVAVRRRMVADVPVGVLLSGGVDSSLVVGLLAEQGQRGLATFSIGFESAGGRAGDEFRWSDVVAERFATDHHRIRVGSDELAGDLDATVAAMSEPMVSHDVVAFHLLSREVSRHITVVQSGQGADEVFAGYHWYPPMAEVSAADAPARYATAFFDRDHEAMREVLAPQLWEAGGEDFAGDGPSMRLVADHLARPGAATAVDAALRLDTEVMLVDDPVKRVDNMTMAWGLEARVPFLDHELVELAAACPPELKLADGGKGVLKAAARRVIPREVIDRPKGYFPVPAITHLEGKVLDVVRDALHSPAAAGRGLFRPEYVAALLGDPNAGLTPLGGNRLWQLGLLEWWLQSHEVG